MTDDEKLAADKSAEQHKAEAAKAAEAEKARRSPLDVLTEFMRVNVNAGPDEILRCLDEAEFDLNKREPKKEEKPVKKVEPVHIRPASRFPEK